LARIYETLPRACPVCQSPMRIIAFITDTDTVRKILDHLGESTRPLRIAPARGPPLFEAVMASGHANGPNGICWHSQNLHLNSIIALLGDSNFAHPGWACVLGLGCTGFWC